jgi:hypothetical protein
MADTPDRDAESDRRDAERRALADRAANRLTFGFVVVIGGLGLWGFVTLARHGFYFGHHIRPFPGATKAWRPWLVDVVVIALTAVCLFAMSVPAWWAVGWFREARAQRHQKASGDS